MASLDDERLRWSLSHGRWSERQAAQALAALASSVERVVARSFPPEAGYEARRTVLSGMLDGVRIQVSRGEFRAIVSAQHLAERDRHALRLVGTIHGPDAREAGDLLSLARRHPWALAAAVIAAVAALLFVAWVPGFWGYCRVAMLMGFSIMMSPAVAWIVNARPPEALEAAAGRPWPALPPAEVHEHLHRWRRCLAELLEQELVLNSQTGQPFRR
ncbi:MAG: hypothetical protein R3A51_18220 [Nannocystaceae bacterium]|nr:hypothetical protein [Myxococcales bacterium]